MERERSATPDEEAEFRQELDPAVLSPVGLEACIAEIQEAVSQKVEIRERGAGDETVVLYQF